MAISIKKETLLTAQLVAALILVIVGCSLLIAGFIVNPLGVIHGTVLTAFGETCAFSGALFGVEYTYKYKLKIAQEHKEKTDNQK